MPPDFPLAWADKLRGDGHRAAASTPRPSTSAGARKTDAQLAGIRRAQPAADAAMGAAAELLRELPAGLTCEQVRERDEEVCAEHGAELPDTVIVAHGAQSASGHEEGHGPIERGGIVLIDIWPRDKASRCWADMTRTFVAGGEAPPAELQEYWELDARVARRRDAAVKPGAVCREIHAASCEPFEAAGKPTVRTKPPDTRSRRATTTGSATGSGSRSTSARTSAAATRRLIAGDVVTVEPGCYRPGFGGCRLEDLVLVTEDGARS